MRFVCDVMLGKLAKYLRILGFDAIYAATPAALDRCRVHDGDRILLTRRKGSSGFATTVRISSEIAAEQLREIKALVKPAIAASAVFGRCIECNVTLIEADKADVEPRVPEFVYHHYTRFKICPSCKRVYWEGSHTSGMAALLKEMLS
jgi:uncharacterized protein with PIN domain